MEKRKMTMRNTVHAMTDRAGSWGYQWATIGYSGEVEGSKRSRFSVSEVENMVDGDWECSNIYRNANGKLAMEYSNGSAITEFNIVNGIIFDRGEIKLCSEGDPLKKYAFDSGLASVEPVDLIMMAGIKTMKMRYMERKCDFEYNVLESVANKDRSKIVGILKRFGEKNKYSATTWNRGYKDERVEVHFDCDRVEINEKKASVRFIGVPFKYAGRRHFMDVVRNLDLGLYLLSLGIMDENELLAFGRVMVRDDDQYHWLDEDSEDEANRRKSNSYWYGKQRAYWVPGHMSDKVGEELEDAHEILGKTEFRMIGLSITQSEQYKECLKIRIDFSKCNIPEYYALGNLKVIEGCLERHLANRDIFMQYINCNEVPVEVYLNQVPKGRNNIENLVKVLQEIDLMMWAYHSGEVCSSHIYRAVRELYEYCR